MELIGIVKNETTPKISESETMFTISSSDSHRGGDSAWCIGNGQLHDAMQIEAEVCKTLNCLVDPMKVLIVRNDG